MKKVDFIGIGQPKSGTTWIFQCLKEHPEITMSQKDFGRLKVFDNELVPNSKNIYGEYSVYLFAQAEAPKKLHTYNQKIKIFVCLRNPFDRIKSQLTHFKALNDKYKNLKIEDILSNSDLQKNTINVDNCSYNIKNYYKYFPKSQFKILFYDDLQNNPEKFIKEIYDFLEVDNNFTPKSLKTKIGTSDFKVTKIGSFIHKKITPILRKNSLLRKIHQSKRIRQIFFSLTNKVKHQSSITTEDNIRKLLYNRYIKEIEKLEKMTGRDLSHWKK